MPDEREDDDVESGGGSAGEPEALDPEAARERWSSRRGQPKSKFDELQALLPRLAVDAEPGARRYGAGRSQGRLGMRRTTQG
jgi:hypothetical protein